MASLLRALAVITAVAGGSALAMPALADEHGRGHEQHHDRDHDRDRDRDHDRRGPSFGFFFGGPGYVPPPPVYYAPPYPGYAPVPITGVYLSPYGYGYCRDYRTMAGIETACQGADGVWRFIN